MLWRLAQHNTLYLLFNDKGQGGVGDLEANYVPEAPYAPHATEQEEYKLLFQRPGDLPLMEGCRWVRRRQPYHASSPAGRRRRPTSPRQWPEIYGCVALVCYSPDVNNYSIFTRRIVTE